MILSTLPINYLVRCLDPPQTILEAAERMQFRGMILIYLVLEQDRFSEFDAHYFPEEDIPISRLSEPKNYSATSQPHDRTVLCAELPCDPILISGRRPTLELGGLVRESLSAARIPLKAPPLRVVTRRLAHAYPIYKQRF